MEITIRDHGQNFVLYARLSDGTVWASGTYRTPKLALARKWRAQVEATHTEAQVRQCWTQAR